MLDLLSFYKEELSGRTFGWFGPFAGTAGLRSQQASRILASNGFFADGRRLGEVRCFAARLSVENTVRNANGQLVQRILKNKELRMTSAELERLIGSLLDLQDNRCALTGIPFQFHGPDLRQTAAGNKAAHSCETTQ
jgi:hypothetical protein